MHSRSHDIRGSRTLILALVAAKTAACGVVDDSAFRELGLELETPEWSSSMPASSDDGGSTTGWDMGGPGGSTTWWDSDDSSPGSGGCNDVGCGSGTGSDFGGGTGSGGIGGGDGSGTGGESSSAEGGGTGGESSSAEGSGTGGESSSAEGSGTGGESSSAEGGGTGGESSSAEGSGSGGESGGSESGGADDTGGESGGGETGGGDTGGVTSNGDTGSGGDTGDQCALVSSEFEEHVFLEGSDHADGELPQEYPPGWAGRKPLPTPTECNHQFWIDSDGVAPEIPGCHQEYTKDCAEKAKGLFGEACDSADELVETNPGAGVCHGHKNGIGNPDIFSCNHYCLVTYEKTGSCQVTKDTCGIGIDSAYCRCDFNDPT